MSDDKTAEIDGALGDLKHSMQSGVWDESCDRQGVASARRLLSAGISSEAIVERFVELGIDQGGAKALLHAAQKVTGGLHAVEGLTGKDYPLIRELIRRRFVRRAILFPCALGVMVFFLGCSVHWAAAIPGAVMLLLGVVGLITTPSWVLWLGGIITTSVGGIWCALLVLSYTFKAPIAQIEASGLLFICAVAVLMDGAVSLTLWRRFGRRHMMRTGGDLKSVKDWFKSKKNRLSADVMKSDVVLHNREVKCDGVFCADGLILLAANWTDAAWVSRADVAGAVHEHGVLRMASDAGEVQLLADDVAAEMIAAWARA